MSLLCYPLPGEFAFFSVIGYLSELFCIEYLPGKRALAIGLCIYHSISSTVLYGAPRFVPVSFGHWAEGWVSWFFPWSLFLRTTDLLFVTSVCTPPSFSFTFSPWLFIVRLLFFCWLFFFTFEIIRLQLTPETFLATVHGVLGLLMVVWWQGTLHIAKMSKLTPRNKRSM